MYEPVCVHIHFDQKYADDVDKIIFEKKYQIK